MTCLLCHILTGLGALTSHPGIIASERYAATAITIEIDRGRVSDIVVDGPLDSAFIYSRHGYTLATREFGGAWLVEISGPSSHEQLVISRGGALLWTQQSAGMGVVAVALFQGNCEVSQ